MSEYDGEIVNLVQQILGQSPSKPDWPASLATEQVAPEDMVEARERPDQSAGDLAELAIQELSSKPGQPSPEPKATVQGPEAQAESHRVEAHRGDSVAPEPRQTKTASELAAMIEADLASHPQCPRKGFQVTVYGATHWRAMLTIKPAAGPVRNPQQWRDLTEELADRLRRRYDLDWR